METEVQVGKYTLESLTTGMYSDPMIVYREYIQNSVDSLENAVQQGIIDHSSMKIDIIVSEENSRISIRDNGTGIRSSEARATLMNVGNSKKRNANNRGFRGIGRLGGMSYCDTLIFYTSFEGEKGNGYDLEECPIFVGEEETDLEPVYKPNKSRFRSDRNKKTVDEISSMEYFDVTVDGELYALGWYGNCGWYGFLSDRELSGFRVRKGNILIGDSRTLNGIFKESRFNGWTQGEIFIVTDKLVPNARRDDFEQNEAYYQFIDALSSGVAINIARSIREASQTRNDPSAKVLKEVDKKISEATAIISEGFNSSVDKEKLVEEMETTVEKNFLMKLKMKMVVIKSTS